MTEQSTPFDWLVRVGFLARGLTYGLVGALALAVAFGAGTGGTAPDQGGALALVSRAPLGFAVLVVIAAGLLAYAAWKLVQAIRGRGPEGGGGSGLAERAANGASGVVYLVFCGVAIEILAGSGAPNSNSAPKHAAAGVLGWPAGPWLVGIAGVLLICGAIYQAYYGLSERFTKQIKTGEMSQDERRLICTAGKIGFVARALVLAVCGYFLTQSAISYDPKKAVGVDGALAKLHHETFGPWIVGLVGIGLIVFAGFSLFEARYRRL